MNHKRIATLALLSVSCAYAQPDYYQRLRTDTDPARLLDDISEYYNSEVILDEGPSPQGNPYPIEIARKRLADDPARYAPEIERRLTSLVPPAIRSAVDLATLAKGAAELDSHIHSLMYLVTLIGRAHAEPILQRFYDDARALRREAQPIYDAIDARTHGNFEGDKLMKVWVGFDTLWQFTGMAIEAADILHSPIFIDDILNTIEQIIQRPEDQNISGFAEFGADYLSHFVLDRPDIYTRLEPLADVKAMVKLGDPAYLLATSITDSVNEIRRKLTAARMMPPTK